MGKRLYVGNLSYNVGSDQLEEMFSQFGTVTFAQVVEDRDTGRSKGFGFVEMSSQEEAQKAISLFHQKDFQGRALTVDSAKAREQRPAGDRPSTH